MHSSPKSIGDVLLVDDDESVLGLYARHLQRAGFEVEALSNGLDALGLLGERCFDVIVSDIKMPGVDGLRLLRTVRRRDLDVPVVLVTGAPEVETAAQAVEYGAVKYLTKPFEPEVLVSAVERATKMGRLAAVKREALDLLGDRQKQLGDRAALELAFEHALKHLWMAYQPVVSARTGSVHAYEALVRSENKRLSSPELLIDAAQRLGRLDDFGRVARLRVAQDIEHQLDDSLVYVNLHPDDLSDDRLLEPGTPLLPHSRRIFYEVTERAALSSFGKMRSRIESLRARGFRIGVDDMGAGYAGLSTFALLEPELIKIDMSLVRNVQEHHIKQRIIRSIVELAQELGIESVVMEGVETQAERDALYALGADLLQGFLISPPVPPEELKAWAGRSWAGDRA
ncbi:MAG: EAL domain-containing protein [Vicinamibacterales bacterium]|jgi:EAL domain-containing protein (putative c-di-GMP-specific phosphodiesterase class I)/CheY-like chemotaxis protein|nr:EAL domain-containing protein [Vicinamibacterales bacterium]